MTTKLEELARKLTEWGPLHQGEGKTNFFKTEISTALKPLLDAAEDAGEILISEGYPDTAARIARQLSQWKPLSD